MAFRRVSTMAVMKTPTALDQPKPQFLQSPLSAIPVTPQNTSSRPDSAKKRGCPRAEFTEATCWTDQMVEALLEIRRDNISCFLDTKDKKGIIRGWSRVALAFNSRMKLELPIDKIKSKYQNLQKVYRSISQTEKNTTGNVNFQ